MILQVRLLLVELGVSSFHPEVVTAGAGCCLDEPSLLRKLALIAFNLLGDDGELCKIVGFNLNSAVRRNNNNLIGQLADGLVFLRFRIFCLFCR